MMRAAVPLDAVALAAVLLRVQLEVYRFADCTALAVVVFALPPQNWLRNIYLRQDNNY